MSASRLASVFVLAGFSLLGAANSGCTKEEKKVVSNEPKKTTEVPDDMGTFNDFLAKEGAGGLAVKLDGGAAAIAADGGAATAAAEEGEAKPALTVTDPGAEPRAPRKYAFAQGKTDRRVLTITQEQARGAQTAPGITLKIALDLTPKKVQPATSSFEAKVAKVEIPGVPPGPQAAQLGAALAGLKGLSGTFDVTSRGEAGEVSFNATPEVQQNPLAEGVLQGMQQAIELLFPPFPDAPIGVGAKWERVADKHEGGVEQKAKHLFTLKDVEKEGGTVEAELVLAVPKRAIQAKGAPPGATVSLDGKGTYVYAFQFAHPSTKVTGQLAVNQHIEATDPQTGKKQSVDEKQTVKHTIETPAGAAAAAAPLK